MLTFFFQGVQLYNAYAAWAMCRAGFGVLDVYPRSESLPKDTDSSYDPHDSVFKPTEEIPLEYFRPRNDEYNGERKQRSH